MNRIYRFIASAVVVVSLASCGDFLDLYPATSLSSDKAILNIKDAQVALNGVYDGLQESESYYGAQMIYRGDVCGDSMQPNGGGKRTSNNFEMNWTNASSPNIWSVPYNVIRRANNVIQAIESGKVSDGTVAEVNHIKGQALAVRALCHFDLTRNYGNPYTKDNGASLGVPIVLTPLAADSKPARSTVAEVYEQVIKDLTDAILLLNSDKEMGSINKQAAQALLARVYLYKGDNQKAFDTATGLITTGGYSLWSNSEYVNAWKYAGTSEVMFEIVNASTADWVDRESIGYLMNEPMGYADLVVSKKFNEYFVANPTDVRGNVGVVSTIADNKTKYGTSKVWLKKYPGREGQDIRINNVPILRISETYLIAAEAAVKLGNKQAEANTYLNAIIKRARPEAADVVATLDNVLWERAIELLGEGHRFYDLMRNNLQADRSNRWPYPMTNPESEIFGRDYYRAILAIPQAELNVNKNIVQNPKYAGS